MIDFAAIFADWLKQRAADSPIEQLGELDELASELYDEWLDTEQDAFGGIAPRRYFDDCEPRELIDALMEYADAHLRIPDPLCDAINEEGRCVELLLDALDSHLTAEQNQAVLERLSEMQVEAMIEPCMQQILSDDEKKADQAVQAILLFGQPAAKMALENLAEGELTKDVTDRLADVVACCGPCEGGLEMLCKLFEQRSDKMAFYAQCLAKTGDDRALPYLQDAAKEPELSYFDFVAIRDAIEELGGEAELEREFPEDKDYAALQEDER